MICAHRDFVKMSQEKKGGSKKYSHLLRLKGSTYDYKDNRGPINFLYEYAHAKK